MGKQRTYRWERRKARNRRRDNNRTFQAFWGFEIVLFIVIFFLFVVGARFMITHPVSVDACFEAISSFGQSKATPSVFVMLFWITLLAGLLWSVISIAYFKIIRSSKSGLFHIAQLLCLVLLVGAFNTMRIDDVSAPEGTLATDHMIVDTTLTPPLYFQRPHPHNEYTSWVMGADSRWGADMPQACVWSEKGVVIAKDVRVIDGWAMATEAERKVLYRRFQQYPLVESFWPGIRPAISTLYGDVSGAEFAQSLQTYRPMTEDEKTRFKAKQDCLRTAVTGEDEKQCIWYRVFDSERYNLDYAMGRLPTRKP